jgi:putative holliday junction resolvase
MGKILAIDYGLKRIGLAISDEGKKIALPLKTLTVNGNEEKAALAIKDFISSYDSPVESVVIGHPLLLNGKKSDMTLASERFAQFLKEKLEIEVFLFDERLSSAAVDISLRDIGINRKKRTQFSDEQAACVLLQNYLDCNVLY